jgi:putative ABC transport system substrate-binding protein
MNQNFIIHFCLLITVPLISDFVQAQQPKTMPRIGYVSSSGDPKNPGDNVEAFRQGLRELGYIEGKNIQVEYRYIQGRSEGIENLVIGLIQQKVDVLVTSAFSAARVAKQETKTIPIVINLPDDPVVMGLVDSLARPGGNITGINTMGRQLSGKRLELLLEAVPTVKRIAVLWSRTNVRVTRRGSNFEDYEIPARALKITAHSLEVRNPAQELDGVFREVMKGGANAVVVINTTPVIPLRKRIADLAMKNRLPSLAEGTVWVEAGALLSYAADNTASYRRLALFVDKILKGAKPSDLPIEQPTKYEFAINLNTAKQIGINISQSVLYRADKVIK